MSHTWAIACTLHLTLLGYVSPAAIAQDHSATPVTQQDLDAGVWAGVAGLVVATGGLLTNFTNAKGKIAKLELDRLQKLQDDLSAERSSLRKSFDQQMTLMQESNDVLQERIAKLETQLELERQSRLKLQSYFQRKIDSIKELN